MTPESPQCAGGDYVNLSGGFDPVTGLLEDNPNPQVPVPGLITVDENGLDASDSDGAINITNWPVLGMYQPDALASYEVKGETFIITANEGDGRDYDGFSEEAEVKDLVLDPTAFPNAAELQADETLGSLTVTTANGDTDGDGDFDKLYAFGGRSFSIWDTQGNLVYDSGDDFEQITAALLPENFNSDNTENNSFDSRSDNKGPEPEGVAIGAIDDHIYAFIGLERIGGVMVYDVTNPESPTFIEYVNNRNFEGDALAGTAGDLGPEGLTFIAAEDSPNGKPLLAVANEVSGTTTLFEIANTLNGTAGKNSFDGDDLLYGGSGNNTLTGGDGKEQADDTNTITDADAIAIKNFFGVSSIGDLSITQTGDDTSIGIVPQDLAMLAGI